MDPDFVIPRSIPLWGDSVHASLTLAQDSGLLHSLREKFKCVAPSPAPSPQGHRLSCSLKTAPLPLKQDRSAVTVKCLRGCETDVFTAFHV